MAVVGAVSVIIDFGVFNALLSQAIAAGWANLVALVVATTAAFWGNLRWSFAHRTVADPRQALVAFFVVNLASAAVVEAGVVAAAWRTSDPAALNAVKLLLTVIATIGRFVLYRTWVYRDSATVPEPSPVPPPVAGPG
jgi:putative flippase GtrA